MGNVIEKNPADGQVPKLLEGRRMRNSMQDRACSLGLKSEGNEARKATGLILQFSQAPQVIDSMMGVLDMSVQHGACAVPAHLVPGSVHLRPLLGTFFAAAYLVANFRIKDLSTAARNGPETILPKKLKRRAKGNSENAFRKVADLNGCERLDDQFLIQQAQTAQELQVPITF